jgi:hypothetical protein
MSIDKLSNDLLNLKTYSTFPDVTPNYMGVEMGYEGRLKDVLVSNEVVNAADIKEIIAKYVEDSTQGEMENKQSELNELNKKVKSIVMGNENNLDDLSVAIQSMLSWKLIREYGCEGNELELTLVEFQFPNQVLYVEFTVKGVRKSQLNLIHTQ